MKVFVFIALISPHLFLAGSAMAACGSDRIAVATSDQIDCLPKIVCKTLRDVADRFGSVTIVSGYRPLGDNARRGGAKHSMHLSCRAVDFLVPNHASANVQQELANFLETKPGRYNVYCTGRAHFDDSNRRNGYSTCVKSGGYGKGKADKKKRKKHRRKRGRR